MNKLIFSGCLALLMIVGQSCKKKGCTDKFAINYNIVADKDDGSCKYCVETQVDKGQLTFYFKDDITGSQYYNQEILRIDINGVEKSYNDQSCGGVVCYANITLTNLIPSNIAYIDFRITVYPLFGGSWYYNHLDYGGGSIPQGSQFIITDFPSSSSCGSLDGAGVYDYLYDVNYN